MRSLTDEAEATVGEDVGKYPHHKEYSDYHAQHFEVPRGGQVTVPIDDRIVLERHAPADARSLATSV